MTVQQAIGSQAPGSGDRPAVVALYVAIPREAEAASEVRKPGLKTRLARGLDIARAYLPVAPDFRWHMWDDDASNKGDIAIREEVRRHVEQALAPRPVTFLEIGWGKLNAERAAEINQRADLFVIGGSGYLFPNDGVMPPRLKRDAEALELIKCPKVAYGIGWNTLIDKDAPLDGDSRAALTRLVRALDLVSVRDALSQQRVEAATGMRPQVTVDPVLLVGASTPRPSGRCKIGINIACHSQWAASYVRRDIDKYAFAFKTLQKKYDAELHFMSHSAVDRVVWWLLKGRGVKARFRRAPSSELPAIYSEFEVVVAQMMHSTIFAMGAGVPTVAIGYDVKMFGLFAIMGMSDYIISVADWNEMELIEVVGKAIREGDEIRQALKRRKAELARANEEFLAALPGLVAGYRR